jgi:hypothetical protein
MASASALVILSPTMSYIAQTIAGSKAEVAKINDDPTHDHLKLLVCQ